MVEEAGREPAQNSNCYRALHLNVHFEMFVP
jgi:hypothetical protein